MHHMGQTFEEFHYHTVLCITHITLTSLFSTMVGSLLKELPDRQINLKTRRLVVSSSQRGMTAMAAEITIWS